MRLAIAALALAASAARAELLAPLSLGEAVHAALTQNPQVLAARASQVAASARVGQARAPWLPQAQSTTQLRGDYSYQTGATAGREEVGAARYSSTINASQLLYDFGRVSAQIRSALAAARAAAGDERAMKNQIALAAATGYAAVLEAEALREVARQNLAQQEQRLRQAESFFTIGTRPEIDVLIARTAMAQARLQMVQADNRVRLSRVQLTQVLGVSDDRYMERPLAGVPELHSPEEDREVDALLDEALALRPEHAALRERALQAEAQVRASLAGYYPQLSLNGSAGISGSLGGITLGQVGGALRPDVPTAGQPGFSVGGSLSLSWPFFSGLSTVYAVREARALLAAAQANLLSFQQRLRSDLQQALFVVAEARQSLQAAETVLAQAEQQLAAARGRYEAGVGSMIELGDAQVGAASARAQKIRAEYALSIARLGLRAQLGTLIESILPEESEK